MFVTFWFSAASRNLALCSKLDVAEIRQQLIRNYTGGLPAVDAGRSHSARRQHRTVLRADTCNIAGKCRIVGRTNLLYDECTGFRSQFADAIRG